ncbi:MAG: HEAT repeat domain-containing protein, partial [Bryobacteraceae bacterium]
MILVDLFVAVSVLRTTVPARTQTVALPRLSAESAYSLLVSAPSPPASPIALRLEQNAVALAGKTLHLGDPDLYVSFRVPRDGAATLRIEGAAAGTLRVEVNRFPSKAGVELEPNNRWEDATPIRLGETVFASADDVPYIPLPGAHRREIVEAEAGLDWYRLRFEGAPKLVFFQIELMERDNIPVDVAVFRVDGGKLAGYNEGEDPVALPHEVQALAGNKFTARVLKAAGDYYVRVRANHPEYKLRTRVYDPPPYRDPREAVRTALDFIVGAGDSWHANTPRRGGVYDRVAAVHQETSLCVACHPTHFSQRAQLVAARNGYPVVQRQPLQFLAERFYNNPRPFYGFERQGAVWSRVISAPANVLSRMSVLLDLYESEISGRRRDRFHQGVVEYLKLYY